MISGNSGTKLISGKMKATHFDLKQLADLLKSGTEDISFALIHGSAKDGIVKEGSDIDIAVYFDVKPTLKHLAEVVRIVNSVIPNAEADVGVLNNSEPVYRFEALKGRPLFINDKEKYLRFFSLTCREYESQMADYERQRKYRLESNKAYP